MVIVLIASAGLFGFRTDDKDPAWGNVPASEYTDKSVYVLGISNITEVGVEKLSLVTSKITIINETASLSSLVPEKDILIIDGFWLAGRSSDEVLDAIVPLARNGTPIALIYGSDYLFDLVNRDLHTGMSVGEQDIEKVIGFKNSPTVQGWGAWATYHCEGYNETDTMTYVFVTAYDFGVEFLSNTPPQRDGESETFQVSGMVFGPPRLCRLLL
jgi:hypothetical protein